MNLPFVFMASDFGKWLGTNKLYIPLEGRPLYRYGLKCLMGTAVRLRQEGGHQIHLVAVNQYRRILEDGGRLGLETMYNGASGEGIMTSLRLGTGVGGEDGNIFLFLVADRSYMKSATLAEFVRGFIKSGSDMGCVCNIGERGNPAVFSRLYREELLSLREDKGGSVVTKKHPMDVWSTKVSGNELKDTDVQAGLNRGQEQPGKMQAGKRWSNE